MRRGETVEFEQAFGLAVRAPAVPVRPDTQFAIASGTKGITATVIVSLVATGSLAFSTQAAYAAPLILLAQNRQDDRDRVSLEEDRARAERTKADTEYLARELAALRLAVGETVTRDYLRGELEKLFDRLADREPVSRPADG